MPLDPQARSVLDLIAGTMPDMTAMEPADARALSAVRPPGPIEPVARVEDRVLPGPAGELPVALHDAEGRLVATDRTDEKGRYRFGYLPGGGYALRTRSVEFFEACVLVWVPIVGTAEVDVPVVALDG